MSTLVALGLGLATVVGAGSPAATVPPDPLGPTVPNALAAPAGSATTSSPAALVAPTTPQLPARPTVKDLPKLQSQVETLLRQAEVASEEVNQARTSLQHRRTRLIRLETHLRQQQAQVTQLSAPVDVSVVGDAVNPEPESIVGDLTAVAAYDDQRREVLDTAEDQVDRLQSRRESTQKDLQSLVALRTVLAENNQRLQRRSAAARTMVDRLKTEQAREILGSNYSGPMPDVAISGRAAEAVKFAMAQVGKAYVYGATGSSSYDCSGLTMRAWGAAGVGLPHSSSAQSSDGTHVSESELRPGDLVFYYSPISHVGMYIGNGLIVNAENPSAGVRVTSLHAMPYSGAVRPG